MKPPIGTLVDDAFNHHPRAAVAIVSNAKGEVLMVYNPKLKGYCFPGGKVETGEHPDAAVRRELKEETGLTTDLAFPVTIWANPNNGSGRIVHVYAVVARGKVREEKPGCHVIWMPTEDALADAPEMPYSAFYREAFFAIGAR